MEKHKILKVEIYEDLKVIETKSVAKALREELGQFRERVHLGGNFYFSVASPFREDLVNVMIVVDDQVRELVKDTVIFYKIENEQEVGLTYEEIESLDSAFSEHPAGARVFEPEIFHKKMGLV